MPDTNFDDLDIKIVRQIDINIDRFRELIDETRYFYKEHDVDNTMEWVNNIEIYTVITARTKTTHDIIGCICLRRLSDIITELVHTCVHPNYRQRGLGTKLGLLALENSKGVFNISTINVNKPELEPLIASHHGKIVKRKFNRFTNHKLGLVVFDKEYGERSN